MEKDTRFSGVLRADWERICGGRFLVRKPLDHAHRKLRLACLWDELHERQVVPLKPLMHRRGILGESDPPQRRDPPPPARS
jgi:hypothetical protein